MSPLTTVSVNAFLSGLRKARRYPHGRLNKSEAPKIQTKFGISLGQEKSRLCLDELEENCFKVAAYIEDWWPSFGDYWTTRITLDGQSKDISVNIKSLMKRFDLPRDVIINNLSNLGKVVRLVQEKRLFQAPDEEIILFDQEHTTRPLLPIRTPFTSLIPLEQIAKIADKQNRCFRLSKRCYSLARSVDVYPGGFIAVDTGRFLGKGRYARVKISVTLQGLNLARRAMTFNLNDANIEGVLLRIIKIFNEFKGITGVLDTLKIGIHENKVGGCKFVSFHPLYDQNLNESWKNRPTERDRLKMTHELLQGLNAIAEKGVHRDITHQNILFRTTPSFEAVIADFEWFRYHDESENKIWNNTIGPESYGIKREVWDLGKVLYYVLQTNLNYLPWDFSGDRSDMNQEDLNRSIVACKFSSEVESLLRGMLALDPEVRWTAKQSLEHFENYLSSRQKKDHNSLQAGCIL